RLAQAAVRQALFATESLLVTAPALYLAQTDGPFDASGYLADEAARGALRQDPPGPGADHADPGVTSVLEHLLQIVETAAINALEELGNARIALGLGRIVGGVLALAATAPDHPGRARRPRSHGNRGRIARERQRGFQDLVAIGVMRRVEGEQPFGECRAVLDGEFSHRADLAVASGDQLVAREARMPFVQAVEVPHGRPDLVDGRLDLDGLADPNGFRGIGPARAARKRRAKTQNHHGEFHLSLPLNPG